MSEQEKIYVSGIWIKEHTFQSTGNTILKVGAKVSELVAFLESHADDDGYINMGISRRKTASDKGITHTVWLDTWKPKQQGQPIPTPSPQPKPREALPTDADGAGDNLPF